jgi:hypothetical protein
MISSRLYHQKTMVMRRSWSRGGTSRGNAPMSVLEALRWWRCAKPEPSAGSFQAAGQGGAGSRAGSDRPEAVQRRARSCLAKRPVLTAGACTAAMLLLAVPLFTLEADARGGGGGRGGGGFGGHGGFGGRGGGMGFAARGGGMHLGGARSFGVARIGGAHMGPRSFGVARFGGARLGARPVGVAHVGGSRIAARSFSRTQSCRSPSDRGARSDGADERWPICNRLGPHGGSARNTHGPLGPRCIR